MTDNPYSTPQADISGPQSGQGISQDVVDKLTGTRPWVLFIAIVAMLFAVLMTIIGLVFFFGGAALGLSDGAGIGFAGIGSVMGIMYLVIGLFYFFPAIYMIKYASRIKDVVRNPNNSSLAIALDQQRKLWKFLGILTIIAIVFFIASTIIMPIALTAMGGVSGI
ncbi:DUF5362 family protein [Porticoccus sp. W117]|uniref:DUF5362 family protein n=1 Tax=Porticoccus sp. W117 TaxID=3054777 RepID=UPI002597E549|nr:DUF5362 family protein [Porticoccus sp. W117]MDM3870318.1 DUF5362 family protein [Porticoccus sp. W117]